MKDGVIEVQVVFVWGGWDEDGNCGQKCGDFGKMQEQNTSQHDQLVVIGGLGPIGFGIRIGVALSNNSFHFRESQECKPPGPKPTINP